MPDLPSFPVDDVTLGLLEHAMGARLSCDEQGEDVTVVGADMTISQLLDFLSGYDEASSVPLLDDDGCPVPGLTEYVGGPLYTRDDVIRSLIAEVRRLRSLTQEDPCPSPS